jgi:protein-ribulosamine 3-kinase
MIPVTASKLRPLQHIPPSIFNFMALKLDLAIVKALSLDVSVTSIASHGSSGFSSTAKITTQVDGEEKVYFVKTASGRDAETMFAGAYGVLTTTCH